MPGLITKFLRFTLQPYAVRLGWALLGLAAIWQPLEAHQPHDPMNVVALSPNYAQDQTVFVATSAVTMPLPVGEFLPLMSTNGGFTFTVLPGLPNQPMHAIAISPGYATDGTVFMAGQGGLWMTTNKGGSWAAVGGSALDAGVMAVVVAPNFPTSGVAFAITARNVFTSTDHGSTWEPVTAPSPLSSNLSALAISSNYAVDSTISVGTISSGIFVSTNSGHTWTLATSGLTLPKVSSITFSPAYASDQTILATTQGQGVYMSTNSGANWSPSNSGLTDLNVTAMALSPSFAGDNLLWVSTATAGVFLSHNRASSWTVTGTVPRPLSPQTNVHYTTLAAAKAASGTALFVGMFEGLWNSSNGGTAWTYCDTIPTRLVRDLALSPNYPNDQTIFVSTYGGGTLWSYSGGETPTGGGPAWTFRNTGLPDSYTDANAMAPNYSSNKMVWIGTTSGLQRVSGANTTWGTMEMCGKETFPRSLGVSSGFATDSTMFIGTHSGAAYPTMVVCQNDSPPGVPNRGLFSSVNAGENWDSTGIEGDAVDSIGMSPNYPVDQTVFAGSSISGLFKSTDGGVTFSPITVVQGDNGTLPVVCSPAYATDQTVFTGTSHSGIFKSTDGGSTWNLLPGTSLLTAFSFALSPDFANDQTLFMGTLQQGLMKSTDGGQSFTPITAIPGYFVSAVAVSSGYPTDQTVVAASYLGLYKSTDGGVTWIYLAEPARQEEQRQFGTGAFYSIIYTGTWNIVSDPAASTIQLASTTQSGATATLTFLGSGVEWIGKKSTTGGTAQVLLDGVVQTTVNLHATATEEQQQLWVTQNLVCAPHTIAINATPGANQNVNLDALDVWQNTCPWATAVKQTARK
jgi:hypothetical protein